MNDLILDVKKYIANFDEYAWFALFMFDTEFKAYASSNEGVDLFIRNFIRRIDGYTTIPIVNLKHSIDDLPARHLQFIFKTGGVVIGSDYLYREWYHMGKLHRDNDMAAYHGDLGERWYNMGEVHRDK